MENRNELTDEKNQIQWLANFGIALFAIALLFFIIIRAYVQTLVLLPAIATLIYFIVIKKQNYKRIYFDDAFVYFDDEKILFENVGEIRISKLNGQYGTLEYEDSGRMRKIFFAGYLKTNLSILTNKISTAKTLANTR